MTDLFQDIRERIALVSILLLLVIVFLFMANDAAYGQSPVCYSCFFKNDPEVNTEKITSFFQNLGSKDPLISGDARFIVWRATGKKDCGALADYSRVTGALVRLLTANANIGFSSGECDVD